jgi:NitT/TauT family transport system ATP-binding protein
MMMHQSPILAAEHISHAFHDDREPLIALHDISLRVYPDEFVCLVGPSGSGKSTLLHILAGLVKPDQGRVLLDGKIVDAPPDGIGFVFQDANLMPWRTVLENVALPLELGAVPASEREAAARRLITLVGLEGFEATHPAQLSGGMAQRVAIARALITAPDVLLFDEPFGALDALTREQLGEELLRIWQAQHRSAVMMVTHSISEAIFLADRVLVLSPRPGHIEAEFPVELPRPRTLDALHSPESAQLARDIRQAIRLPTA